MRYVQSTVHVEWLQNIMMVCVPATQVIGYSLLGSHHMTTT
jgi:hypothetical protein